MEKEQEEFQAHIPSMWNISVEVFRFSSIIHLKCKCCSVDTQRLFDNRNDKNKGRIDSSFYTSSLAYTILVGRAQSYIQSIKENAPFDSM